MLPPRLLRRLVLAPLAIVIALAVAVLSPLLAVLTLAFGLRRLRPGRMRGLRLLYFALIWLAAEASALFMSLGLWVASGLGGRLSTEPYQSRHYAIMRWYLDAVSRAAERTLGLRVEIDGPPCGSGDGPVIVLSRHAGPGDSFLLVHYLIGRYGRRPRVVMKATLQLDPGLDVVTNRLPNVFVQRRRASGCSSTRSGGWPAGWAPATRWSYSPRAATGRRPAGSGASGGWSRPAGPTWRPARGACPTCSGPGPAARSRPSRPAPPRT
jgi:hypothetical protein